MNAIIVALDSLLRLLPSLCLFLYICDSYFRYSNRIIAILAVLYICANVIPTSLLYAHYQSFDPWLPYIVIFTLTLPILLCFFLLRVSWYRILLMIFVTESYMDSVSLYKDTLGPWVSQICDSMMYGSISILTRFLVLLVTFPIMWLFCKKLLKPIMQVEESQPFDKYLWLVPTCFFVMYRLCVNTGELEYIEIGFPSLAPLIAILWTIGTFIVYTLILRMLLDTIDKAKLERELEFTQISTSVQRKTYEDLLSKVRENRRQRHDFRHHIFMIKQFCDAKQYEELQVYINAYIGTLSLDDPMMFCDNAMINTILQYYDHIAKDQHIECTFEVSLPKKLQIDDADICTLLGNAMENAIEACCRQESTKRFIHLQGKLMNQSIMVISIRNSYEGDLHKNHAGVLLSSKRSEEGIGVSSIQSIVKAYNGVCNIEYQNNIFELSCMLILSKETETATNDTN